MTEILINFDLENYWDLKEGYTISMKIQGTSKSIQPMTNWDNG